MTDSIAANQTILVAGGGIIGMPAALEAAEYGKLVILAERARALGGRTARLDRYFPKMRHPTCGLEINLRPLKANRNLRVLTLLQGQSGHERQLAGVSPGATAADLDADDDYHSR